MSNLGVHHNVDWSRSAFFNAETEEETNVHKTPEIRANEDDIQFNVDTKYIQNNDDTSDDNTDNTNDDNTNDDNTTTDDDHNQPQQQQQQTQQSEQTMAITPDTTQPNTNNTTPQISVDTDNPIMNELVQIMIARFEHLVERGFLNPQFLGKIRSDPQEIIRFIRQNRAVVGDQLNRRLNPSIRPSPQQLELKGIVPKGYFTKGHEVAMTRKHRRKSSAQQDLAAFIQLRPKPEQLAAKGIGVIHEEEKKYVGLSFISDSMNRGTLATTIYREDNETWEISILGTLLFKTISEALSKSCLDTQKQEAAVLGEMEKMNLEMKQLRDALDKYFLDDEPDVLQFEQEEEMIREKFHGIQNKLLTISQTQNSIHEKLRILHSVERAMIDLQNIYDKELGQLRKTECDVLKDLKEQRTRREKAIKIRVAEKSHSNWAMAKLDHTIIIAAEMEDEDGNNKGFIDNLNGFLTKLRFVGENQNNIVRDFDFAIDELESHLLSIRHDMSKVRTMTFKKIYDLHKQVEIAESLELGNRRLSVASATEIERERRHFTVKIQRQLSTLSNQIAIFPLNKYQHNLREIIDIQYVMSHNKLKSFFSVFISSFNQTICDIHVSYDNLIHLMDEDEKTTNAYERDPKIKQLCMELYGIKNILLPINYQNIGIIEKIIHCMKFIQISQNALLYEIKTLYFTQQNEKENDVAPAQNINIELNKINDIVIIIARKLSIDNHIIDAIDRTNDDKIPNLAQQRVANIFEYIIKTQDLNQIFKQKPKNAMDVATIVLNKVFAIENNEENDSYLN